MSDKHWYLLSYDIRDPKRWRKIYERIKGSGERIQYSVFKIFASPRQIEELRLDLRRLMADDDDLLVIHLCPGCARRVVDTTCETGWSEARGQVEIL